MTFTLYSFRYSFATLSPMAGELDKAVSAQMGHAGDNFRKDVCVQALPEMRQAAPDRFEQFLLAGVEEVGTKAM